MSEAFERDVIDRLARLEERLNALGGRMDAHLIAHSSMQSNGVKKLAAFGVGIGVGLGGSGSAILKLLGGF